MNVAKHLVILAMLAFSLNLAAQDCGALDRNAQKNEDEIVVAIKERNYEGAYLLAQLQTGFLQKYPKRCIRAFNGVWYARIWSAYGMDVGYAAMTGRCEYSKEILEGMLREYPKYKAAMPNVGVGVDNILITAERLYNMNCKPGGSP